LVAIALTKNTDCGLRKEASKAALLPEELMRKEMIGP
jgi:hypothetical protein